MAIAFTILSLLIYFVVAYFVVTKLLIPADKLWVKILDGVILGGVLGVLIYSLVKLL